MSSPRAVAFPNLATSDTANDVRPERGLVTLRSFLPPVLYVKPVTENETRKRMGIAGILASHRMHRDFRLLKRVPDHLAILDRRPQAHEPARHSPGPVSSATDLSCEIDPSRS